jgi:hypothetical protein
MKIFFVNSQVGDVVDDVSRTMARAVKRKTAEISQPL